MFRKIKSRSGLTLVETLIVVAIAVILLAVAFIGVNGIVEKLRQTELDSDAQILYVAAQDVLSEMYASNRNDELTKDDTQGISTLDVQPSDWGESDFTSGRICVMTSNSAGRELLLPKGSVADELYSGQWVIEYDPVSGFVYSAFFSKDVDPNEFYSSMDVVNDLLRGNSKDNKKSRITYGATVGYYGGNADAVQQGSVDDMTCRVNIFNNERLYAELECDVPTEHFKDDVTFCIEITGQTSGAKIYKDVTLNYLTDGALTRKCTLLLDSLKDENGDGLTDSFRNNYCVSDPKFSSNFKDGSSPLIPGENITIKLTAKNSNPLVGDAVKTASCNSLYADFTGNTQTAEIAYGRHLQNLNPGTSGVGIAAENGGKVNVKNAVQIKSIDFVEEEEGTWADIYGTKTFVPINNSALETYKGDKFAITGLTEKNVDGNGGLFGTFSGSSISGVRLIGTTVSASGSAGALAGVVSSSATISDCQAYLARSDYNGTTAKKTQWIKGGAYAGGLVGKAEGALTVNNSLASTVVRTTSASGISGGLAGSVSGKLALSKSYADCYLFGNTAGGLAGAAGSSSTISECYSAGYLMSNAEKAAGFVPGGIASMSNSYTVFSFRAEGEKNTVTESYSTASGGTASRVYYLGTQSAGNAGNIGTARDNKALKNISATATELGSAFSKNANTNNTTAYNLIAGTDLKTYPYPSLADTRHYGDWAETEFTPGTLVYYEIYKDGTWGYWGGGKKSLEASDGTNGNKIIVRDGYALIYEAEDTLNAEASVTVNYNDAAVSGAFETTGYVTATVSTENKSYLFRPLSYEKIVNKKTGNNNFYQHIVVSAGSVEHEYYFNPHFAGTVFEGSTRPILSEAAGGIVSVRTARNLFLLSEFYPNIKVETKDAVFNQERNINYNYYKFGDAKLSSYMAESSPAGKDVYSRSQNAIGNGTDPFCATYDGNCNIITGISLITSDHTSGTKHEYAGLFGYVGEYTSGKVSTGTLKNIVLTCDYVDEDNCYSISHSSNISGNKCVGYMGLLAGYNGGRISNCAVAGYSMKSYAYRSAKLYSGGLVGYNSGTIKNCSADIPSTNVEVNISSAFIGGFAGLNENSIVNSYSLGNITARQYNDGSVFAGGFAGRNTGRIYYAYCSTGMIASGIEKNNVYGFTDNSGSCSGSYYLDGGTYFYVDEERPYHADENPSATGIPKTNSQLIKMKINGFGTVAEDNSFNHDRTTAESNDAEKDYPYPACVKDSKKDYVHYGEWTFEDSVGDVGMFYWEKESKGTNNGYHFYIVDKKGEPHQTLCEAHDDGGIIEEFGYGYYTLKGQDAQAAWGANVNPGQENTAANEDFDEQFTGQYDFHCFTTTDAYSAANSDNLYLKSTNTYGTLTVRDQEGASYLYRFTPFFAKSIVFGNGDVPGRSDETSFKIRSVKQLEFMNWNASNLNATTVIGPSNYSNNTMVENFIFLGSAYGYSTSQAVISNDEKSFVWKQEHDLDADMNSKSDVKFTPIGGIYDQNGGENGDAIVHMAFLGGKYDGQSYVIKNLEISSSSNCVGLFGMTVGATLKNVIMYSVNGNTISTNSEGIGWYSLGSLVGYAAKGNGSNFNSTSGIINCTSAGYNVVDARGKTSYGGANIGGLVGMTNLDIKGCSSVNNITIAVLYSDPNRHIRVGGIVGGNRGSVSQCYSGGTFISKTNNNSVIHMSGISGGYFLKATGNLGNIVGSFNNPVISNSYTYAKLPTPGTMSLRDVQTIASNADVGDTVTVRNCYYLGSFMPSQAKTPKSGVNSTGTSMTYDEMCITADSQTLLNSLNNGITDKADKFRPVTIFENPAGDITDPGTGASIPGKYSFPAGDNELDRHDYPFPTVITQNDSFGDTVSVHYGVWPKDTGIFSEKSYVDLDLLSYTGTPDDPDYKTDIDLVWFVDNKQVNMTSAPTIKYSSTGNAASSILDCSLEPYTNSQGIAEYRLKVKGLKVGTETIIAGYRYNGKTYTVEIEVTVTAEMRIRTFEVHPDNPELYPGGSKSWYVKAYDRNNIEITGLAPANWQVASDDISKIKVSSVFNTDDGIVAKVDGYNTGMTNVRFTCVDVPVRDLDSSVLVHSATVSLEVEVLQIPSDVVVSYYAGENVHVHDETVAYGTKAAGYTLTDEQLNGRAFRYWADDEGSAFDFDTNLKNNTSLYAVWDYNTVTLVSNGKTAGHVYVSGGNYYSDKDLTDQITSVQLSADASDGFTGYYLADGTTKFTDNTGAIVYPAESVTGDMVVTAQYGHRLTLSAVSANNYSSTFFIPEGTTSLTGYTAPARSGWTLAGWYTTKTTSGVKVLNADGSIVKSVDGYSSASGQLSLTSDVTLYAKWTRGTGKWTFTPVSKLAEGEYVIASISGKSKSGYMLTSNGSALSTDSISTDSSGNLTAGSNAVWTVEKNGNSYRIKDSNGKYLSDQTNNHTLSLVTNADNGANWKFPSNDCIRNAKNNNNNYYLVYYSSNSVYYSSGFMLTRYDYGIYAYKKGASTEEVAYD